MFYWFTRNGAFFSFESRQSEDNAFELSITDADGSETVQRFFDEASLTTAEQALVRRLRDEGWTGPHGWVL